MAVIDVGADCLDLSSDTLGLKTILNAVNPANDTGTIDHAEAWAAATMTGVEFGVFEDTGGGGGAGSYTCRGNTDGSNLTVTAGACRSFDAPGDFTTFAVTSGYLGGILVLAGTRIERANAGSGVMEFNADGIATDDESTFSFLANRTVSHFMSGETAVGGNPLLTAGMENNMGSSANLMTG